MSKPVALRERCPDLITYRLRLCEKARGNQYQGDRNRKQMKQGKLMAMVRACRWKSFLWGPVAVPTPLGGLTPPDPSQVRPCMDHKSTHVQVCSLSTSGVQGAQPRLRARMDPLLEQTLRVELAARSAAFHQSGCRSHTGEMAWDAQGSHLGCTPSSATRTVSLAIKSNTHTDTSGTACTPSERSMRA